MSLVQKLQRLDGRHKLAIVMAIGTWMLSIYFSYLGFKLDNSKMSWIGYFLGALVTTVELIFNSKTHKISLTLILVGVLCYAYGIWTNVTGFWNFQHPDQPWAWTTSIIMPLFVGLILEVLPEAMFMWGIGAELDGDLVGNLVGLWSGELDYATPGQSKPQQSPQKTPEYKVTYPPLQSKSQKGMVRGFPPLPPEYRPGNNHTPPPNPKPRQNPMDGKFRTPSE